MSSTPATLGVLQTAIAYTDNGTSVVVGKLPANAYVTAIFVDVSTAFNGGTTNTVDIGTSADDDYFAASVALGSAARASVTALKHGVIPSTSVNTSILAKVVSTAGASAGVARITVQYVQL